MKLLIVFFSILAISVSKEVGLAKAIKNESDADLEAAASMELLKTDQESLETSASTYYAAPQKPWDQNQNAAVPQNDTPQNSWNPPLGNYNPQNWNLQNVPAPVNNFNPQNWNNQIPTATLPPTWNIPTVSPQVPSFGDYKPPSNLIPDWSKPQNVWNPQSDYVPPQNSWTQAPQNTWTQAPQNTWTQAPQNTWTQAPQNTWTQAPQNTWTQAPPTSTTPSSVIKNEQFFGENGSYKYEYQIADGTHVGEEGYVNNPNTDKASVVKKGWYSYPGADGKIYTVNWWADESGFHAFGDHLPTPPPVPPAIQAAIDQAAKEEAAKAEAEKNKPQQPPQTYPQQTWPQNQQTYPQNQQTYPQNQQTYPQNQQTYPQNQQTYPQNQQTYPQNQQTYPQNQQTYPQNQQTYPQYQPTYPQTQQDPVQYQPPGFGQSVTNGQSNNVAPQVYPSNGYNNYYPQTSNTAYGK